jgi:hypothetical protein
MYSFHPVQLLIIEHMHIMATISRTGLKIQLLSVKKNVTDELAFLCQLEVTRHSTQAVISQLS